MGWESSLAEAIVALQIKQLPNKAWIDENILKVFWWLLWNPEILKAVDLVLLFTCGLHHFSKTFSLLLISKWNRSARLVLPQRKLEIPPPVHTVQ